MALGRKIIFEWGGSEILGVREKSLSLNGEAINVTSDEDDGWQVLLDESGEQNVEISVSGVTKDDVLKQDWFSGDRTKELTYTWPNGAALTGQFRMSVFSSTGPYSEAETFEATFQSTGEVTYIPYS